MINRHDPLLDEDTLAAYLTNRLSPEERADVTAALVRDPDARELLKMAVYALRAADRPPIPSAATRETDERLTRRPGRPDEAGKTQ